MNLHEFDEYISAFVDQEFTGLSNKDIAFLLKVVDRHPELMAQCQLELTTKLWLARRMKLAECPNSTIHSIRGLIYHLYKTQQASLGARH